MREVRALVLLSAGLLLSSCSFFQREPPLPRHAVVESGGSEEKFNDLIQEADIIYFPTEAAVFASRSDPVWKLLEALRRDAQFFALAWDGTTTERERREYLSDARKLGATLMAFNEAGASGDQSGQIRSRATFATIATR